MASLCFLHVLLKKTLFGQLYLSNKLCGVFPLNRRDRLADTVITIVICITAVINLMPQITKTTVMGKFPKTVLAVNRYVRFPITRCSFLYRLYCTSATNHHDFVYGMRRNQSSFFVRQQITDSQKHSSRGLLCQFCWSNSTSVRVEIRRKKIRPSLSAFQGHSRS